MRDVLGITITAALLLSLTSITAAQNQSLVFEVASVGASVPTRNMKPLRMS